jgi:hypothetical protein
MATNKGTWDDFRGINGITDPLQYKIAQNLIKNELSSVSNGYVTMLRFINKNFVQ